MRCKIAVWQQAYGLVKQTERLFIREFKINSRQTIYVIYRKIMATGSVVDTQPLGTKERTLRGKNSGVRRRTYIESREIHTSRSSRAEHHPFA